MNPVHHANHFNFLRLVAAFLVFYGHAHILLGVPLKTQLDHTVGLYIFFSISGYLISMSWDRDPSLKNFFLKRTVRIFPGLIVVTLLSVFILGPLVTTYTLSKYFMDIQILLYLKNIFLYISYTLPGVFEHNIFPYAVNGSLWSLPVEFLMYILIAFLNQKIKIAKYLVLVFFIGFACCSVLINHLNNFLVIYGTNLQDIIRTGVFFWVGASMYHWNIKKYFHFEGFVLSLICLIFIAQWHELYSLAMLFVIPYMVLNFGFSESKILSFFNKADYSYGFYIYAFPIQQSIINFYPHISLAYFLPIGFIITLVFAIFSWHLIEKPIMQLQVQKQ